MNVTRTFLILKWPFKMHLAHSLHHNGLNYEMPLPLATKHYTEPKSRPNHGDPKFQLKSTDER